jgi:hypothetical protein
MWFVSDLLEQSQPLKLLARRVILLHQLDQRLDHRLLDLWVIKRVFLLWT